MRLADDVLTQLEQRLAGRPGPRVRALHLPPRPWNGSKDGEFGAIELDTGRPGQGALGLSYLLLDGTLAALDGPAGTAPALSGSDALQLARLWRDGPTPAERALGFAAVNALSRHLLDACGRVPPDAPDSIGGLQPRAGDHIGMVGLFPPLLKQVTGCGARLTVLELRADLVGRHAGCEVTLDPAALRHCDAVLLTSTVLLNHTLDELLPFLRQARALVMIGPGAGLLPDALFERGLTAVGGSWVVDGPGLVSALVAGQAWGRCARKFVWTRGSWSRLGAP